MISACQSKSLIKTQNDIKEEYLFVINLLCRIIAYLVSVLVTSLKSVTISFPLILKFVGSFSSLLYCVLVFGICSQILFYLIIELRNQIKSFSSRLRCAHLI